MTRWPDHLAAHYREAGYWTSETLDTFLRSRAVRYADRPAVRDERRAMTYAEFDAAVDRAAGRLASAGIARGERIIVQLDNRVELYLVQFGLFRLGAVPIMALPAHDRVELEQFCRIAEPVAIVASGAPGTPPAARAAKLAALDGPSLRTRVLVVSEGERVPADDAGGHDAPGDPARGDNAAGADAAAATGVATVSIWMLTDDVAIGASGPSPRQRAGRAGQPDADGGGGDDDDDASVAPGSSDGGSNAGDFPESEGLAFLQLSGGSTGISKLIPRTHADYLYSVRESARICELGPDDVMLIAIPAAHNYSYSSPGALGVWHAGGEVVLASRPDPVVCLPLLATAGAAGTGATIVPLVPPLAHLWLAAQRREPVDVPRLRMVQVGGAKLSAEVAREIERAFATPVQQVFGMAEGLVNYTRPGDDERTRTETQGLRISEADEVRAVDVDGREVAPGEVGALETQGPYTIRGYYRNDVANRASFASDGWYRTGDLVRIDERGYLTVVGRAKAIINRGGEKVSPEEVEQHLHADERVLDAVVEGVADDVLGERIRATVVPRRPGSLTPADVRGALRGRGLADYKLPDQVRFADSLERTGVGKNRRASPGTASHTQAPKREEHR